MFVILTPNQIQYGGFIRARMKKNRDMIRDRARILCLIFLWLHHMPLVRARTCDVITYLLYT